MANLLVRDDEKEEIPLLEKASELKELLILAQVKGFQCQELPGSTGESSKAGLKCATRYSVFFLLTPPIN
jgi:hypothetical protein